MISRPISSLGGWPQPKPTDDGRSESNSFSFLGRRWLPGTSSCWTRSSTGRPRGTRLFTARSVAWNLIPLISYWSTKLIILPPYCEVTSLACFFTPASIASLTCIDQRTILSLLLASMKEKLHPRLYFCIYLFTKTTILRRQNSYFFYCASISQTLNDVVKLKLLQWRDLNPVRLDETVH